MKNQQSKIALVEGGARRNACGSSPVPSTVNRFKNSMRIFELDAHLRVKMILVRLGAPA
jgi:hypothetical protein